MQDSGHRIDPHFVIPAAHCEIVVPCYNEAARLDPRAFAGFLAHSAGVHFIFVDDGSTDSTMQVLEALRADYPERVRVTGLGRNQGKAAAVRCGLLEALSTGAAFAGYWDADLATPLDEVADLLAILEANPACEMVFGARVQLLGRQIERKPLRHYLGRCFASAVSVALRLPIYDSQCGAKLFRATPAIAEAFAEPFMSRWIFDVEILARFIALRGGDRQAVRQAIYEYPLRRWRDVGGSKVHPSDFLKAFAEIFMIWNRYLRSHAATPRPHT